QTTNCRGRGSSCCGTWGKRAARRAGCCMIAGRAKSPCEMRDAGTWYAAWAILRTRSCLGTDRRAQNRATGWACGEVWVRDFAHPTGPGARVGSLVGVALAALGLFIHIPAAQAQGPRSWRIENNGVRHVVIPINKSKTFRLDQPFATAIVGSP